LTNNVFSLNDLDLIPTNDIYVTDDVTFDPSSNVESNTTWHGTKVRVTDIQPKTTKVVLKGYCLTEAAQRSITKYDANNYNWNTDPENLYLVRDLSRRWKIRAMDVSTSFSWAKYPFSATITLSQISGEGYTQSSKTGVSASSPINVANIVNAGDKDTLFESMQILGGYSGGANLTLPLITHHTVGYDLKVADVILDTAYYIFYNDYTAKHVYIDSLNNSTLFTRNKSSSTNVTFDSDHLDIAANGELKYRFRLTHSLLVDPVLTLSTTITGTPTLEVSKDNSNWWEVEKALVSGNLVDYNLTKLAGSSDFYWRIVTAAGEAVVLSYMKQVSWHNYSGQKPIPYLRKDSVSEQMDLTFSAGSLDYDFRYRDAWSI